ncbi:MAG: GNAT family N-acetyltransferase [Pseudomonadota bacterium]
MEVADSPRLSFAPITDQDAELLFELDQDPEVMRYINGGHMTTMEEVHEVFIPRLNAYRNPVKGWGLWKVTVKDEQRYVGWILVRPMDFFGEQPQWNDIELGWRFKRDSWGKGYATEAARAVCDAIATQDEVQKISAVAMEDNLASIGVMKKLGMRYLKTDIHKDPLGDMNAVFYSMDV